MKHFIIAIFMALGLVMGGTATPAQAEITTTCGKIKMSIDAHNFPNVYTQGVLRFKICKKGASTFVKPISFSGTYIHEQGDKLNCGWEQAFEGVKFDIYLWDALGRNFHPTPFTIGCVEDGVGKYVRSLRNAPYFFFAGNETPKWKANLTSKWSWGIPDNEAVISGNMYK